MNGIIESDLDPELENLAQSFIDAVEGRDFDKILDCYSADAVIWHNTDNVESTGAENVSTLKVLFTQALSEFRYEDIRRIANKNGYVQQHTLRGKTPGGEDFECRACFVVTVRKMRITRLDEYLDASALQVLSPYL